MLLFVQWGCCLEGHLVAGCSPPQPLLLQACLYLQVSPRVQPLVVLKRMQISVPSDVCVTASVAGPSRARTGVR